VDGQRDAVSGGCRVGWLIDPSLVPLAPVDAARILQVLRYRWAQLSVNLVPAGALLIEVIGCLSFLLLDSNAHSYAGTRSESQLPVIWRRTCCHVTRES
jgi:hypothetical protein